MMAMSRTDIRNFTERNPGSRLNQTPNMGMVIQADETPLYLTTDIGMGTAIARLIRREIKNKRMDECVAAMRTPETERSRPHKRLSAMLDQFNYEFSKEERTAIMKDVCQIKGSTTFLEVAEDKYGFSWILFHSGAEVLSEILIKSHRFEYLDLKSQMEDLVMAQKFAKINRLGTMKRLFKKYYGSSRIEEAAFVYLDFPYHAIDLDRGEVRLGIQQHTRKNNWSLLLSNVRDGSILYQTQEPYTPSGCGRIKRLSEPETRCKQYTAIVNQAMLGIYHGEAAHYMQRLPMLYQPADSLVPETKSKIVLKPKYNFRPGL